MDRYLAYGIRTDADEQIRRGFRDAFARAGLSHQQFLDALGWYRDHGQHLGADPAKLTESFHEFASGKGWDAGQVVAATSAYELIAAEGPAAVLATPSSEDDVSTIARADALLKSDPAAYWRDEALQEAALEARERQLSAPPPEPGIDHDAIERRVAQQTVDRFAEMLRKDPAKYWASPELQRQHYEAIAAATGEAPQPAVQPAAVPSPPVTPTAAPTAAPAQAAVSDAARRIEIEALMRVDGGKGYWRDQAVQREYGEVLARLAGEAPPLAPAAGRGARPCGVSAAGRRVTGVSNR
jgi:hypothetical protein